MIGLDGAGKSTMLERIKYTFKKDKGQGEKEQEREQEILLALNKISPTVRNKPLHPFPPHRNPTREPNSSLTTHSFDTDRWGSTSDGWRFGGQMSSSGILEGLKDCAASGTSTMLTRTPYVPTSCAIRNACARQLVCRGCSCHVPLLKGAAPCRSCGLSTAATPSDSTRQKVFPTSTLLPCFTHAPCL